MKIAAYEVQRARKRTHGSRRQVVVTRNALIRAFSSPAVPRSDVLRIVAEYMGGSPVPPSWSKLGVRASFGKRIERRWSRYIRRLQPASYRSENGRWLTPIVQHPAQFGTCDEHDPTAADIPTPMPPMVADEFHYWSHGRC